MLADYFEYWRGFKTGIESGVIIVATIWLVVFAIQQRSKKP